MSLDNFLSFLQQLLSMVDSKNKYSIALAKVSLNSTVDLAIASGKVNALTHRVMYAAKEEFDDLVRNANDFAGKPGEYEENRNRRQRLLLVLRPGC